MTMSQGASGESVPPWERDSGAAPSGGGIPPPPSMPSSAASSVPSPDADVLVRTMRSDIASLGLTGGNRPQAQAVRVQLPSESGVRQARTGILLKVLVGAVVLAVAAVTFYYFVLPRLKQSGGRTVNPPPPTADDGSAPAPDTPSGAVSSPPPTAPPSSIVSPPHLEPPLPAPRFTHQSFFRKNADQTLTLTIGGTIRTAADLQTYAQKFTNLLAPVSKLPAFVEVRLQKPDASAASFGEFMYELKTAFFAQWFVAENFNPDVTFFAFKDKNGSWPGFVLQLKPSKNWLFLKAEIVQIEESPGLETLFIAQPGTRAPAGFVDETIGEVQARTLSYVANPNARFIYGWFQNYFVVATSREAFLEALKRL